MAVSFFYSLSILVALSFTLRNKRLHLFEVIFLWIIITFFYQSIITILSSNMKLLEVTTNIETNWAYVSSRLVLIPTLITWFIEFSTFKKLKAVYIVFMILIMITFDFLFEATSVIKHVNWSIWKSLITWFIFVWIIISLHRGYRAILKREVRL
jgi:hypothetical protein